MKTKPRCQTLSLFSCCNKSIFSKVSCLTTLIVEVTKVLTTILNGKAYTVRHFLANA